MPSQRYGSIEQSVGITPADSDQMTGGMVVGALVEVSSIIAVEVKAKAFAAARFIGDKLLGAADIFLQATNTREEK